MAGEPLVDVDETTPLRPDSKALYPATKAQAEMAVREANRDGLETVVVRPRLVWGVGDTTILPGIAGAVRAGRFRWINGGRHLTATTHVDNTVEGLWLGASKGRPGERYFVTDGEPVVFREFVTELLATQGVEAPDKEAPAAVARLAGPALEAVWGVLRRRTPPPVTRLTYWLSAQECTIDISKARSELGYEPVKTRAEGMRRTEGGRGMSEVRERELVVDGLRTVLAEAGPADADGGRRVRPWQPRVGAGLARPDGAHGRVRALAGDGHAGLRARGQAARLRGAGRGLRRLPHEGP